MGSPTPNPNPYVQPQPVYYRHRRSIAGPTILIVIGVVFLLRNFGVRLPIWHLFGRFWPVLLILWGVIRLIEYSVAQREGYRRVGLGAGSVFLLILIVIFGLSAHYSSDVNWGGVRDQIGMDDDLGGMFGNSYSFDDTVEQAFPAKGTLRIVSDRGAVTVSPSDGQTIRVVVHKKLRASNQQEANKYNEATKPQITATGNSVLLNANTNGSGEHGVESDMDIFVPRDATLDIASKRGDVTVADHKTDVKINLQHGDVSLTDVGGNVQLNLDKGSIRAAKVSGDIDINGHVDNVTLDEVAGNVRLNGDFFDDIRLSKIGKTATFKSSRSDMSVASVPGNLDIDRDSVRGNEVNGPSRLITSSKEIHLENVSGDLQVETTNGDIEVRAANKLPVGKMTISGRHSEISVVLPPNAGFQIDATTHKGDISSDFPALKIENNDKGPSRATGTVGNGAAKLQITSDTGDVRISKS
jgi:DUF4097 and DUF4098 domain-containing protein YvlB